MHGYFEIRSRRNSRPGPETIKRVGPFFGDNIARPDVLLVRENSDQILKASWSNYGPRIVATPYLMRFWEPPASRSFNQLFVNQVLSLRWYGFSSRRDTILVSLLSPQQTNNLARLPQPFMRHSPTALEHNLCLDCA